MRRTLSLVLIPLSLCVATPVLAQDGGFYARAWGGVSDLRDDTLSFGGATATLNFDTGVSFGGAFGYDYPDSPLRAEVEFNYRSADATDIPLAFGSEGDFASTSLMINGIYAFDTGSALRPYVGLGIGALTEIDFDIGDAEFSDRDGFAYQAMIGVEYPVSDRFALFAEARYFSAGSVDLETDAGEGLTADYDSIDINFGGSLKF